MALTALTILSGVLVAAGVGMVYVPAGVICAGLLGLVGCYVVAYLRARGGDE